MGISKAPAIPTIPSALVIPDHSGARRKDHKARNTQSRVLTVTPLTCESLTDPSELRASRDRRPQNCSPSPA